MKLYQISEADLALLENMANALQQILRDVRADGAPKIPELKPLPYPVSEPCWVDTCSTTTPSD